MLPRGGRPVHRQGAAKYYVAAAQPRGLDPPPFFFLNSHAKTVNSDLPTGLVYQSSLARYVCVGVWVWVWVCVCVCAYVCNVCVCVCVLGCVCLFVGECGCG